MKPNNIIEKGSLKTDKPGIKTPKTPHKGEELEARYANFFKIGSNAFEFLLDFGQFYPQNGDGLIHTRVVMSPVYAKALLQTLSDSISQYEKSFEEVKDK